MVTSAADDPDAVPWDDPETESDEASDGTIEDLAHRQTLRAAIQEAWNMNNGKGTACALTIAVSSPIVLTEGSLDLPDGSILQSSGGITIDCSQAPFALGLGNNSTVKGIQFSGGKFPLTLAGDENWVIGCTFTDAEFDAVTVVGKNNIIGGTREEGNTFLAIGQAAISIVGDSNAVAGNNIGISLAGDTLGCKWGIFLTGSENDIGGNDTGYANTISANWVAGIAISGDLAGGGTSNHIKGNYIGTNRYGTEKRGNRIGIEILDALDTEIGVYEIDGAVYGFRNVISGNTNQGILVSFNSSGTWIQGNIIGFDASATTSLGNRDGIVLGPGSDQATVLLNHISGNDSSGIVINGLPSLPSAHHDIYLNSIWQNWGAGVAIIGDAFGNRIGAEFNDTASGFVGNAMIGNGRYGVVVTKSPVGPEEPEANMIRRNAMKDNGLKGIEVVGQAQDGILPPLLVSAAMSPTPGEAVVNGTHDRVGARIDLYLPVRRTIHIPFEGYRWVGSGIVQSDNTFSVSATLTRSMSKVIATATDMAENTSEFSEVERIRGTARRRFRRRANAVSASVVASNSSASSVFPGASGGAYAWGGGPAITPRTPSNTHGDGYVTADTIVNGVGYWVKYDSEVEDSLAGFLESEITVDADAGWNFIGSISSPVAVSDIVSIPAGAVTSQFFGYDTAYYVADTIQPGSAYWVKLSAPASLVIALYDTLPSGGFITIVPDTAVPPPPPDEVLTAVEDGQPETCFLADAYPNPFNPSTTIEFGITTPGFTSLKIYDVLGQEVATLVDDRLQPGVHQAVWDGQGASSGIYFYRLTAGSLTSVKRMLLVR